MMQLPYVHSFKNLVAYQKSRALASAVFVASKGFPREEMYSLTDQVRRSSGAVGANIAEAWAKREYEKHFISKFTDADAEQLETQHWIEVAQDCGYLSQQQAKTLVAQSEEVGRLVGSMIARASSFCSTRSVREPIPQYLLAADDDPDDGALL